MRRQTSDERWYPVDGLMFGIAVSLGLWAVILFGLHQLLV